MTEKYAPKVGDRVRATLGEMPQWHYAARYRLLEDAEEACLWADCPTKIEREYT